MALANPLLLIFGGVFVAIPIVLHLVMRRQPKHLIFPALRFIKERQETNRRRLQLRQWLLLLLRCMAIFLLAAALAGLSTSSALIGNWAMIGVVFIIFLIVVLLSVMSWIEKKSRLLTILLPIAAAIMAACLVGLIITTLVRGSEMNIGDRKAPVAAVLVIDTSPRMELRQSNKTRLEQAQETADWLVGQLPLGSSVAVVDSRPGDPFFSVDVAAARKSVDVLQTTFVTQPLVSIVEKAIRLAHDSDLLRKEVYVFTDMTESAWKGDSGGILKRRLEEADDVTLYVIDVGESGAENFALANALVQSESIPASGELHLVTEITRLGPASSRTVELQLEKSDLSKPVMLDGKLQLPSEKWIRAATVDLKENSSQQVEFYLGGLELGVHQGQVRILGEDALSLDDRRYFTIEVKEAWPVLVVTGPGATGRFLTEAIAPFQQRETGKANYACRIVEQRKLADEELSDYAAVALLDPERLSAALWDSLAGYVESGRSLAVFLGNNASADEAFNGEFPQKLLAGTLNPLVARSTGELTLASPLSFDHPVVAEFRPIASSIPWREFPIYRHWVLKERAEGSSIIFRFGNGRPALIERTVGTGRVLTMTTPVSDPARPEGRQRWNDLPLGNAWPYFILMNEIFAYLVESGETRLNYLVGQTATLANSESVLPDKYTLFLPEGPPQPAKSEHSRLIFPATKLPGAYRLRGSRGGPVVRGFSVNITPESTDLTPADPKRLDELFGENRYKAAKNRQEINRDQGEARVGRQFYPLLIAVLAIVSGLELLLANRFYKKES